MQVYFLEARIRFFIGFEISKVLNYDSVGNSLGDFFSSEKSVIYSLVVFFQ